MFLSVQWKYDIVKVKVSINNFRGKKRKAEGGKGAGGKKKKEETEEEKKLKVVFFFVFFFGQPTKHFLGGDHIGVVWALAYCQLHI